MILMVYILTLIGTIALIFFSVDWTIELYKWQSRIHIGRWTDRKAWQQAVEKKGTPMAIQKPYRTDYGSRSVSPLGYAKRELSFHHHTKLAGCRTPFILARTGRPRVCQTPPLAIHKRKLADRPIAIGVCLKKRKMHFIWKQKKRLKNTLYLINKLNRLYLIGKHYLTFALSIPSDWFVPFYTNAISVI